MIRRMIRGIMNWATENPSYNKGCDAVTAVMTGETVERAWRISPMKAINGRVLEIATFKSNPHGPDWKSELFIVPEGMTVAEGISTLMAIKSLEQ